MCYLGLTSGFQNIDSTSDALRRRVEAVLDMALTTVTPLSESYISETPLIEKEKEKEKSTETLGSEAPDDKVVEIRPKDLPQEPKAEEVPAEVCLHMLFVC